MEPLLIDTLEITIQDKMTADAANRNIALGMIAVIIVGCVAYAIILELTSKKQEKDKQF